MSTEDDRAFYERRLREERARAAAAADEALRCLHLHWAALYEDRLAGVAERAGPDPKAPVLSRAGRSHVR